MSRNSSTSDRFEIHALIIGEFLNEQPQVRALPISETRSTSIGALRGSSLTVSISVILAD